AAKLQEPLGLVLGRVRLSGRILRNRAGEAKAERAAIGTLWVDPGFVYEPDEAADLRDDLRRVYGLPVRLGRPLRTDVDVVGNRVRARSLSFGSGRWF